jgi:glutaredoxin
MGGRVVVYTRAGCHLCEVAEAQLHAAGIAFEAVDIEADDELFKRYLERIPVVAVDGEELFDYEIDLAALRHTLQR